MSAHPSASHQRYALELGRRSIEKVKKSHIILARLIRAVAGTSWPTRVWLTFDDGPDPCHTPRILEALNARSIRATFFVVGRQAERYGHILATVAVGGHRVGNHSLTHPYLTMLDAAAVRAELVETDALIRPYVQHGKIFRPPHGARNRIVDRIADDLGYQTVLWNASTRDFHPRLQSGRWVDFGLRMVGLGGDSVVLMHDVYAGTADHMPRFLDALSEMDGVTFMQPETLPCRT